MYLEQPNYIASALRLDREKRRRLGTASCIPPIGATTLAVSSAAAQEDGSSGEDLELTDEEDAIQELSYAEFPDYNDPGRN
ncbi:hypothetical protein HHUSO_G37021 [Huso huso]|uniref:Uncharacterized protein n=1 Tax=Huso huso TaxID=61971 RepID=A0ABR0Y032_HUSHU